MSVALIAIKCTLADIEVAAASSANKVWLTANSHNRELRSARAEFQGGVAEITLMIAAEQEARALVTEH